MEEKIWSWLADRVKPRELQETNPSSSFIESIAGIVLGGEEIILVPVQSVHSLSQHKPGKVTKGLKIQP